jgi:hypothetical protein
MLCASCSGVCKSYATGDSRCESQKWPGDSFFSAKGLSVAAMPRRRGARDAALRWLGGAGGLCWLQREELQWISS